MKNRRKGKKKEMEDEEKRKWIIKLKRNSRIAELERRRKETTREGIREKMLCRLRKKRKLIWKLKENRRMAELERREENKAGVT